MRYIIVLSNIVRNSKCRMKNIENEVQGGYFMEGLIYLVYLAIGAFILFIIIANAVKMAVKEALFEFKEEIIKEINQRNLNKE